MLIETLDKTVALAKRLAPKLSLGDCVFLQGDLGAGKTTFAAALIHALGIDKKVKSPTFTIVEQYPLKKGDVFHFDLYRINDPFELDEMGIHDYFCDDAICLIEWPEKGRALLPKPNWRLEFLQIDNQHAVNIQHRDEDIEI